jgi:hypothetical protein
VAQGSAAAAKVLQNIIRNKVPRDLSSLTLQDIEKHISELSPVS